MSVNRQWVLARRPRGLLTRESFEYREPPVPEPGEGEMLLRNLYLSFDPAQRGWMEDRESYNPPVGIGEAMRAGSVAQMVKSRHPEYRGGELAQTTGGWQAAPEDRRPGIMLASA